MDNMNNMVNNEEAKWYHKAAYLNQALYDVERTFHDIFDISQNPESTLVECDKEVMFEIPLDNHIRIRIYDPAYTRIVLEMLYDRSGTLMPSCGGRDYLGNAWIKMQCIAQIPVSGLFEAKTEAVLWILRPDLRPQDDPIEYARSIRKLSAVPDNNWVNVPHGEVPQQVNPVTDWVGGEGTAPSM